MAGAGGSLTETDYRDQADFRCTLRRLLRFSEEQARAAGITPQQHVLLVVTRGHASYPEVSIGDLAEALQLRQSSTSLLVDRSVKRGLVYRREDPADRRRAVVSLTEFGQQLLDQITRSIRQEMGALEEVLLRDSLRDALGRERFASRRTSSAAGGS